ncbi:hypothetical protein [Thalassotalea aquiviva]|uniref:glycosyltransferase family protein n=1 Tax=Thalassotalea aquiviva TaxID=3242415 RepID=UPI00352A607E
MAKINKKVGFCIASPHRNENWYDWRVYNNLKQELQRLGYVYEKNAKNRIYFFGGALLNAYPDVNTFNHNSNNIALVYSHSYAVNSFEGFNHIFVASPTMKKFLWYRKIRRMLKLNFNYIPRYTGIDILPPFSSLTPNVEYRKEYDCDISFVGNIRVRPIVEDILEIVEKHQLDFKIFGHDWQNYQGNKAALKYWQGDVIPYQDIPSLAANSKVCLIDHHQDMKREATVSHKYIDLLMSGGCLICDNNPGAYQYKGLVYKDKISLERLVLDLIAKRTLRESIRDRQYEKVKELTTANAAKVLALKFIA